MSRVYIFLSIIRDHKRLFDSGKPTSLRASQVSDKSLSLQRYMNVCNVFEVRNIMLYICFVMFRFKCQTILEAIAVKLKMYDPRDEAKSKGELPFVNMKT